MSSAGRSSILSTTNLDTPDFRWVSLRKILWQDPKGNSRVWECAFRNTRKSECDGVAVIVFVSYPVSKKEDEILLISQYRPPVASEVIESPAGLVDAGEDAKEAAERELLEETGFSGKVTSVSPIVPCDPGMTDANMRFVTIEVNGDSEENQNPKARPEDGEFITLRRLPATSMQEGLDEFANAGFQVDARLYAMAVGYTLGRRAAAAGKGDCPRRLLGRAVASSLVGVVVATTLMVVVGGARRGRS
ncbi:unnamed protein product [Ectocarpus sp. 13 AM-2016]